MPADEEPHYDLELVKQLVECGRFRVTSSAMRDAGELCLDQSDIAECIEALSIADFYKTMPADSKPGLHQDVYRPLFAGFQLYLKLQITRWLVSTDEVVVISFKKK